MRTLILSFCLLAASQAAGAAELLVTPGASAKGAASERMIALDLASDGAVSAVNFRVNLGDRVKSIDTTGCLSDLPSTHTGICEANAKNGRVAVVVWSLDNKPLPEGIVGFGQLKVAYKGTQASSEEVLVDRMTASTEAGAQESFKPRIARDARDVSGGRSETRRQ
jgi:hypothetical protein